MFSFTKVQKEIKESFKQNLSKNLYDDEAVNILSW